MVARIITILILLPSLCYAGPGARRLLMVSNSVPMEAFTINGYDDLNVSNTQSTGVESIATGAGNIYVSASCTPTGIEASVSLKVDGADPSGSDPAYLLCPGGTGTAAKTLRATVTAGSHTVEVLAIGNGGAAVADTFRKPTPKYDLTTFESASISPWTSVHFFATTSESHGGSYSAGVNYSGTPQTIYRTLDVANQGEFSVWVAANPSNGPYNMTVATGAGTFITANSLSPLWTQYSGTMPAGSNPTTITLSFTGPSGVAVSVDDISIQVP